MSRLDLAAADGLPRESTVCGFCQKPIDQGDGVLTTLTRARNLKVLAVVHQGCSRVRCGRSRQGKEPAPDTPIKLVKWVSEYQFRLGGSCCWVCNKPFIVGELVVRQKQRRHTRHIECARKVGLI